MNQPEQVAHGLDGLKVLICEDEYLTAMEMNEAVRDLGAEVVGPVGRLDAALDLARTRSLDGAILDVKLNGDMITPVVHELRSRGVPIILSTGFEAAQLPSELRDLPRLGKPLRPAALRTAAAAAFRRG